MRSRSILLLGALGLPLTACDESAAGGAPQADQAQEVVVQGSPLLGADFVPPEDEGPSLAELATMELSADDIVERSFDSERIEALVAKHEANASAEPEFVGWDVLAGFEYELPEMDVLNAIEDCGDPGDLEARFPLEVLAVESRYVELEGYMVPYEYDEEGIYSFTLVRDQAMCCFGGAFRSNHFVEAVMANDGRAEPADLEPIIVIGTIEVGEVVEAGYVLSLYRMLIDEVELAD